MMDLQLLDRSDLKKYDDFIISFPESLVYAGSKFKQFVEKQTRAESHYIITKTGGEIDGVLPLVIKEGKYGKVINSLPFYGSNGGIISRNEKAKSRLISYYNDLLKGDQYLSGTIIISPFEKDKEFYRDNIRTDFIDERIGQITFLPESSESLMKLFHEKTRNSIRKGIKNDFDISWGKGLDYVDLLFEMHRENIRLLGGLWKSRETIQNIVETFEYGDELKIYVAVKNNIPVAALLCLYFNNTVEYYIPAVKAEFRNSQVMSTIIYTCMCEAVISGYKYWNWGGTWISQKGVFNFKERWGTCNLPYYYYISVNNKQKIITVSKEQLLQEYKYFYIIPFH